MALLSTIRDLHRRKARERRGLALAEGVRLVEEMLASGVECKGAVVSPALQHTPRGIQLRARLASAQVPIDEVSDDELTMLAATEHPQGIVAVYPPRAWSLDHVRPIAGHPLLVLDAVQDPGNVGTIARTALALGASGVLALPGTADLANPKTVRSAAGALFHLPHRHGSEAEVLALAESAGAEIWATAMRGDAIDGVVPGAPLVIVFGNEGRGIGSALAAHAARVVRVPIAPLAESLNVAVTAGIVLYQVTR